MKGRTHLQFSYDSEKNVATVRGPGDGAIFDYRLDAIDYTSFEVWCDGVLSLVVSVCPQFVDLYPQAGVVLNTGDWDTSWRWTACGSFLQLSAPGVLAYEQVVPVECE